MKRSNLIIFTMLFSIVGFITSCKQEVFNTEKPSVPEKKQYEIVMQNYRGTTIDLVNIYTGVDIPITTENEEIMGTKYYCSSNEDAAMVDIPRLLMVDFPQSDFSLLNAIITEYKNPNSRYWIKNNIQLSPAVKEAMNNNEYEISFTMIGNKDLTAFVIWGNKKKANNIFDTFFISQGL